MARKKTGNPISMKIVEDDAKALHDNFRRWIDRLGTDNKDISPEVHEVHMENLREYNRAMERERQKESELFSEEEWNAIFK